MLGNLSKHLKDFPKLLSSCTSHTIRTITKNNIDTLQGIVFLRDRAKEQCQKKRTYLELELSAEECWFAELLPTMRIRIHGVTPIQTYMNELRHIES